MKNIQLISKKSYKDFLQKWKIPLIIFGGISLLITIPLFLKPGMIFLLDINHLPKIPFPKNTTSNAFLYDLLWWFLNIFLPTGVIQKIILFFIFFLSGIGMFRLFSFLKKETSNIHWGAYFAGIFYVLNPITYSRIMVGQWIFVLSYALLPWIIVSFLFLIKKPTLKKSIVVSIWFTLISIINLHVGIITTFFLGILGSGFFLHEWLRTHRFPRQLIMAYFLSILFFVLLNSYWLFPLIQGTTPPAELAQTVINDVHILSFFTRPDSEYGIFWNTAALYGFWGDGSGYYHSQKVFTPYWFYLFVVIGLCIFWGIIISLKKTSISRDGILLEKERTWYFSLFLVGFIAFWIIVGVSFTPIKESVLWIYRNFTLFRAFREPQKFAALLAFIYAIFGGIGIRDMILRAERLQHKKIQWIRIILPGILMILPLLYSPGLFWRFHGQIKPSEYPKSWFNLNEFLNKDQESFQVLFFPWHQYMYLSFAQTVIFNPAQLFFNKPIIAGDNIEFGPIYTQSTRQESKYILEEILSKQKTLSNMGEKLLPLHVKYVILAFEADFFNYSFVDRQKDLRPIFEEENLKVYRNLAWPE